MRLALRVIGLLAILAGVIWALQGANLLGGSRMTGDPFWLWTGLLVFIAGAALTLATFRRPPTGA